MASGVELLPSDQSERGLKRLVGKSNPNQRFENLLHRAKVSRLPFDKETWLNIAFFLGQQYVTWSDTMSAPQRIDKKQNEEHIPRPVSNQILHFVLDEQAQALQDEPTVDVMPASTDPGDISVAKVAKAYLDWLCGEDVADLNEALSVSTLWALAGTEAYLKWIWNPRLGRGEIIPCSPLDIYGDPYAKQFSRSRYVIHSHFMDVEQVYDIYGIEVPPQTIEKTDPVRVALQREMGMAPVLHGATVNELWMPPNRRHPEGLFCAWTGHYTLVPPQKYPYEHGQLPFTQIGSIMRPGTQHYTSAVSALRTPQMELNKFHAQMIQIREAFANPKWWLPDEMDLEELPNDSPRQILRGNSNGGQLKPELIMPAGIPPIFANTGEWLEQAMQDVAGIHDVSQGQVPGRVESAKAISALQEPDNSRLRELRRTIRKSITIGCWQQLRLAQQFGAKELVFEAYSKEGMPEAQKLMTEKLKPGIRVKVTMTTGLAASRQARTDQLMTMWAQGIIQDRELMAELLDLPISSVSPDNEFDIRLARNENLEIASGIKVVPNSWDNHDIHRREHNNYRKTMDYKMLPDEAKQVFEMHCELHDELQIQQLGKMLQIQSMSAAVAQGAGFQSPQPPGPLNGSPGASPVPGQGPPAHPVPGQGPTQPGNGGTMPPPPHGNPGVPNALGAHTPENLDNVRNTPQGMAHYQQDYANSLSRAG